MASALNTISSRMVLVLLGIHAVLLPVLLYSVLAIVKNGQQEAFIDHARIYARMVADFLISEGDEESETAIVSHLDSAVLGGQTIYAAIVGDGGPITSSLMEAAELNTFIEDFSFGEHDDDIYFVSVPLEFSDYGEVLQLGFDEVPTLQQIENVRKTLVNLLLIYFFVSLLLVSFFSGILAKPLERLGLESREVASGDYSRQLSVTSRIHEIRELTQDLETMRSNIVGVNAQLQKEISDREAAEAEQQQLEARLRHAQRLESIGTLAGGIAHEFNNILLPLMLYTDLALEDLPEGSPARQSLEKVLALGDRAKGLSRQILTFGREAGDADKGYSDIAPVVEEAMSLVRALIPASVDIRTDINSDAGEVYCDAAQIQQLVVNLVSNAFRSLSRGGGYIHVELDDGHIDKRMAEKHPRLRRGNYVCLTVTDTGSGMDSATMERIFEPFFTTREVGEGSGLGLSVVHGIVVKHDGEIVVASEEGKGTTFSVFLPKADDMDMT